jgi:hypothetical protein
VKFAEVSRLRLQPGTLRNSPGGSDMARVYAFDVDDTIEQLGGPVTLAALAELRGAGHVVGLCGNWAAFCRCFPDWWRLVSFMNVSTSKETLLQGLREQLPHYDDYILVGNIPGVSGASDDVGAAARAGWRFIKESEFARGVR